MLKTIGIVLLVLIVAALGFAATRPDTFRVERSITIKASPDKIVGYVNDFHQWPAWSPYEKLDPAMQRSYSGTPSGQGAAYSWAGNSKAGSGNARIIESSTSQVSIALDFTKPMTGHDTADFLLAPRGDSTTVTWAMHGPNAYVGKVMSLFFNMDKMIGGQFTEGLTNLKTVSEK